MDFDQAFRTVGEFGRFQKIVFSGFCFSNFVTMFQMVLIVFVGAKPEMECYHKGQLVKTNDTCTAACDTYVYSSKFTSIATEWNLVCERAYKVSLVQSIFMAGVLTGAFVFGLLSDRFGRRMSLFYALAATAFSSMAGAWCSDLKTFLAMRFITGFHNSGAILCTYVLCMELIGDSWRTMCGTVLQVFAALGIMSYALLGYIWSDWRSLVFAASILMLPSLLFYPLIPESPRWLYARGRIHDAELIMDKIAGKNGIATKKIILAESKKEETGTSGSMLDLFKNGILCKITFFTLYTWFVSSCVYYGLTISAGSLGSNMYTSVALSGLVEIPANLLVMTLLACLGRRTVMCAFLTIGGVSCLMITWIDAASTSTITGLALLGKLSITSCFTLIYLWSAEIFPTFVRNAAMGLMSVGARVGGIASPAVILLGNYALPLPYLVYSFLSLTAAVSCCSLPETRNQSLPETTDDLLRMGGHFVDSDDKSWSTELLLEERNVGFVGGKKGKNGANKKVGNVKVS